MNPLADLYAILAATLGIVLSGAGLIAVYLLVIHLTTLYLEREKRRS